MRAPCMISVRTVFRELKKINRAWPDLLYATVKGGLVLSPSPATYPAQHNSGSSSRPARCRRCEVGA